jgi:hypothetical protein
VKAKVLNLLKKVFTHKYFNVGLRLSVGAILLMAGIGKIASGHELVSVVASLKMLPYPLINPVGNALPWFEVALGTLFSRIAAGISLPLFAAFVVTNIFNLHRGITEPCSSCFGNYLVLTARDALLIDVFLLLAAFRVMMLEKYPVSLDSLWIKRTHPAEASR